MKKIIKKILHKWYYYLIAIVVSSVAVILLTNYINMPRNEEVIDIFVGETKTGNSKLYDELYKNKPSYLRQIRVHSAVYHLSTFDYFYTAQGKSNSDLIILPESVIFESVYVYYYTPLDTSYMLQEIPDASFLVDEKTGNSYGIKVRSKGDKTNNIISWADETHDEDYYAFFYKKSLHAGKNNNSSFSTSIDFVKIIKNYV